MIKSFTIAGLLERSVHDSGLERALLERVACPLDNLCIPPGQLVYALRDAEGNIEFIPESRLSSGGCQLSGFDLVEVTKQDVIRRLGLPDKPKSARGGRESCVQQDCGT
ncbi:MAG: hypothetical protein HY372_00125 [Candidatus Andersenbacteria bacterium]|nr:hypothetical protein [Candidatus Andersenbacteria bacterium]